jgi:hypothetical protein
MLDSQQVLATFVRRGDATDSFALTALGPAQPGAFRLPPLGMPGSPAG